MDISQVTFPLYKLRAYIAIDKNPLGLVKISSIKGTYILDDTTIPDTFDKRRLMLPSMYPNEKIYPLKEKILYLRQLVKYKSGSKFIDNNGQIISYTKSSKLFDVKSHKIVRNRTIDNWSIIYVEKLDIPFILGEPLRYSAKYASIMYTDWGPFLYDLTSKRHEVYKRKI